MSQQRRNDEERGYQKRAHREVEQKWAQGARSVLLVSPVGSGKTHMGVMLVGLLRTLWVAHRRELVHQAAAELRRVAGTNNVGILMADDPPNPTARIQVASVETLLARGVPEGIQLLVLDEAHHYMADTYRYLADAYPKTPTLGLSATPERFDGRPLGDIFQELVVAASYSELLAGGYIVPARVLRPKESLGQDLAQDPIEAWERYGEWDRTFIFCARVASANALAERLRARGTNAAKIDGKTAKSWRDDVIEEFGRGKLSVVTSVACLNEGVDVPTARVAVSCRSYSHVGGMLQAYGRVLRPSPGKEDAIILDLCGMTHLHGYPDQDRDYSLTGKAISTPSPSYEGDDDDREERDDLYQEIKGVELVMAKSGALPKGSPPPPPVERPKRERSHLEQIKKIRTKHGGEAAKAAVDYYDRLGR